jgi:hypothetical protein
MQSVQDESDDDLVGRNKLIVNVIPEQKCNSTTVKALLLHTLQVLRGRGYNIAPALS